jgi:pimeloyl-ACP methyl ester carboxylesterase
MRHLNQALCLAALLALAASPLIAAESADSAMTEKEPLGIGLEGFAYPYPVKMFGLTQGGESLRMAYMDVLPEGEANGRIALLLHGRNFPSSYWQGVIQGLNKAGYRVVVPDQIGFNKSSKPTSDLHFDQLASNTAALLDTLGVGKVDVIGHSTGGMLATRLARTDPELVERIVLAAPIGLEDYRFYVPPVPLAELMALEDKVTPESFRQQLMTAYSLTLPPEALDPYIAARTRVKGAADYPRWLRAFANSYQMIWREPVVHEIPLLTQPVLFVMGENDHLAPGRNFAPEAVRAKMGQNATRARDLAAKMQDGQVEVFDGIGHLVHLEQPQRFNDIVLSFFNKDR